MCVNLCLSLALSGLSLLSIKRMLGKNPKTSLPDQVLQFPENCQL